MKYVYLILNWVFGVLFGLTGLISLVESPLAGLCLIGASLLLLPPVRNIVHSKTNIEIPFKIRAVAIFVLFISFGVFIGHSQDKRSAELAAELAEEKAREIAQAHQENIEYFKSNREEVISRVSTALTEQNYQLAISRSKKYLAANDTELNALYGQAKDALDEIRRAEKEAREKERREGKTKEILAKLKTVPASEFREKRDLYQQLVELNPDNAPYKAKLEHYSLKLSEKLEKEIVAKLRTVPASEFRKNRDLYRRLVELNPDNATYKAKLKHYSQKLGEQLEKERKEKERIRKERESRLAKFGEPPTQSPWDGSYYVVERYLKKVANDPDSIEVDSCTRVYHTKSGWLVGCDYRGRNVFGGMIRKSNWFTIIRDQVIQMHDASAYQP